MSEILASLRTCFGFQEFRPGQEEAIGALLAGQHTAVVMPTGAGKSLIYQLAALHRPGLALVISPLIALMKDQVDGLVRRGLLATYINSTLTADEQADRLDALSRGAYRLVYVSPERLRNVAFAEALRRTTVGLLAVDEAHCISQWGHDFRPDYLHIAAARRALGEPLTVALTATATPQVQADIIRLLGLPAARRIVTGFNRPNLAFEVRYTAEPAAKLAALQELLARLEGGAAIVYVGTRRDAEEVADFVREVCRLRAEFYHAGLDAETRTRVQNAFLAPVPGTSEVPGTGGLLQVVVATNAFGMGIDRPDVRLVAHFAMPGTLEAYYQEAGRAGRDGLPARAVLLYSPKDRALQEWFIENDAPAADEVRLLYDVICAKGDLFPRPSPAKGGESSLSPAGKGAGGSGAAWFTLEDLSLATGLPEVKLRVGLAQLEAAGSLERLGDAGPRMLLRVGPWHAEAMAETGSQVEARRRHRREQLAQMVAYAESNACRRRILLDHFGDRSPAEAAVCCDNCQQRANAAAQAQPATPTAPLEAGSPAQTALVILDAVRRLKWEIGKEKLAQLLHGSQAKEMRLYSYDRNPYYGRLAVFSKGEIGGLIDQLIRWGYLKVVGGEMPVLKLTPKAEAALRERAAIPLHLPRPIDPQRVAMKQAERAAGGTVALTAQLFGQGLTPAEIAARRGLTENTILGHLAELIADGVVPLPAVVPDEIVAQIEAAIAQVGSTAQLAPIKQLLPEAISYGQIRCVVARPHPFPPLLSGPVQEGREGVGGLGGEAVTTWLSRPHPRPLRGPWEAGWALGFHSRFAGADWSRSPVGELAYRLKYENDAAALAPLVEQAAALCREHPELADVDALVPVPATEAHALDPVGSLAQGLADRLGKPVWKVLAKTRKTAPQKEMHTLAQKRANVAGAFAARGNVRGKGLLVLDDLYDSGATLEEVARVLRRAGAARLCVLTLTRTIHADA